MIFCKKSYLYGLDEVSMDLYKYFMRIFIINFYIIVKKDEIKMIYNLFNKIRKYYLISIKNSHSDTVNVNDYCEYFHIDNCQLIAHIFHLSSISILYNRWIYIRLEFILSVLYFLRIISNIFIF